MRGSGHLADVEADLDPKGMPPLTTLRQGIVVLSRQWKNALYTPILIEYNLRLVNGRVGVMTRVTSWQTGLVCGR